MPNSPHIARRLALIRLLLGGALEASRQPAPFDTDSINRLHDVAEMFLALAVEEHQRSIPKDFMRYWDELAVPLGRPLGHQVAMQRVNKTRVNLKHYGIQPGAREVANAAATVRSLLEDESRPLFGIELEEVSVAAFVQPRVAANCIDAAERHWTNGEQGEAFADLAEAFDEVISDYADSKTDTYNRSIFESLQTVRSSGPVVRSHRDFETTVVDVLDTLNYRLMLIGFGVDLRRYARFATLVPDVRHFLDSQNRTYVLPDGWSRTDEEYVFVRDFVISTALHVCEFDFEVAEDRRRPGDGSMRRVRSRSALADIDDNE